MHERILARFLENAELTPKVAEAIREMAQTHGVLETLEHIMGTKPFTPSGRER